MEHQPDTLGYHRAMSAAIFGEDSAATKFLDKKIAESPNGEKEGVVVNEGQVVHLLLHIHQYGEGGVVEGGI